MNHYEIEPENNIFKSIVVDLTHRCNMECANCYLPNRNFPDMDKTKLFDFLGRLPKKTFIRLIGAEPTLHPDLPEIVRVVKSLGHIPSVTTNGLKMARKEYVQELWDAGLRLVYLSMNGGGNDNIYKIIDNGKYATVKTRALNNLMELGFFINIGCIIVRGVNEKLPNDLIQLVVDTATKHDRRFRKWNQPGIRFKSVGQIGRHMEDASFNMPELASIIGNELGYDSDWIIQQKAISGTNLTLDEKTGLQKGWKPSETLASVMFNHNTERGDILIRLINWEVDEDGVPDSKSENRGRITKDWKIAPFFEDVKKNEFEY
jgi:uncharacterized Fe-S cluster-containing radical SAM superfamily protein